MQIDKSMRTIIGDMSEDELNKFFAKTEVVLKPYWRWQIKVAEADLSLAEGRLEEGHD